MCKSRAHSLFLQRPLVRRLNERMREAVENLKSERPFITLSFAQGLDGSIGVNRARTQLSNSTSQTLTHYLRARHDAILVGINTVMVDDPRLTVRLFDGPSPRPIVLDSRLRFPLNALLLKSNTSPIVATTDRACKKKERALGARGVHVIRVRQQHGAGIELNMLLSRLKALNIRSVMVEGGARVITNFLLAGLVDQLVLTICPTFIGGLRAPRKLTRSQRRVIPCLVNTYSESLDGDLVLLGDFTSSKTGLVAHEASCRAA